ncbi:MAG: DUF3726 domain-containing protein [Paracoccaceae bacterium]
MILSLGEVEALSRKAARGAGLPWGLAEEAGRAVRHLHALGLDGASALAACLGRPGCPIAAGCALSDGLGPPASPVASPLLLLAFAPRPLRLSWPGALVETDGRAVRAGGDALRARSATVAIAPFHGTLPPQPPARRAALAPGTHRALDALAARTYAPATAGDRSGAGPD